MAQTVLIIIILIVCVDFIFERVLDYLNYRNLKEDLPTDLGDVYDTDAYKKSQAYEKVKTRFSIISSSFSILLILALLAGGGFGILDEFVSSITDNTYLQTLCFFGLLGLGFDLISLPFQVYSTFVIEDRFGFNKTTPLLFISDKLKGWILGLLIGGGILSFLLWSWLATGQWFWVIVVGGITGFSLFMAMFYSRLIVPLFNKQSPLEEGELKDAINGFAEKSGFELDHIFVLDGSKRSSKANAYISGLGKKKRIVLYDTLISDLNTEEIVSVLAHEVGHNKKKHIWKGMLMSMLQTGLMVWLLSIAVEKPELSLALGGTQASFYLGLLAFGLLYSPISFFSGIISNIFSRKYEYEADRYASDHYKGEALIQALKKLSRNNLSNLSPHPAYVFFHYSHPTLLQRKRAIEAISK